MIEILQKPILEKDSQGVISALAGLSEKERAALHEPLAILCAALGVEQHVQQLDVAFELDSPVVVAKRKADGIVQMSRGNRETYDSDVLSMSWLAKYGICGLNSIRTMNCVPRYEAECAQILADRRPPWLEEWLTQITSLDGDRSYRNISASFWARLYSYGLIEQINELWVRAVFSQELPRAFESAAQETQKVLREVEAARMSVLDVPTQEYQLTMAKDWVPVIQFLGKEGLLDHVRLLTACVNAVYRLSNQTERNGSVILARAASQKTAGCPPEVLADLQLQSVSLLSDQQTTIAGFGLEQLMAVQKTGKLKVADAVPEVSHIFQHKAKNHASKAIKLLDSVAETEQVRDAVLVALTNSLAHPHKDVQAAGLDSLEKHLQPGDQTAIEELRAHAETVAATLQPRLKKLMESLTGSAAGEAKTSNTNSPADLNSLLERAAAVPPESRQKFSVDTAIEAAARSELTSPGQWTMSDVRVLKSQPKLSPIASLEELFDVTAAAVERCESADIPEQIVDGIMQFGMERLDFFDARKKPLAKRACSPAMDRPNRGIVGGVLGDAFAHLISRWLDVEDQNEWVNEYYPMSPFLREVAALLTEGKPYPLLSTPTHAGGWIDPRVWVQRLQNVESSEMEFLENDLIRSLLRLTPDGRDEALKLVPVDGLSERFQKLTRMVLDLNTPNEQIALDDSWTPFVWMAAIRARDAWIDLQKYLPDEEQAQVAPGLWALPDVLKPSDYQWQAREFQESRGFISSECVLSQPLPREKESGPPNILDQLHSAAADTQDFADLLDSVRDTSQQSVGGFLAAELNGLICYPAPQYVYPYLATQWPMKLNWYWNLATIGLSRRVESGPSVDERYDQFLLPLFEQHRPLCRMAARALWIATVSKDGNARGMATEVWIAVISEDRCSIDVLAAAWRDVLAGGWMKMNRIAEVFAEVAVVSPLHAFVLALLLEEFLSECDEFPRDTAKLLEVLDECNERLGRAVPPPLSDKFRTIKSGKAKKLSRSLLDREDHATEARSEAVALTLEARIRRTESNRC